MSEDPDISPQDMAALEDVQEDIEMNAPAAIPRPSPSQAQQKSRTSAKRLKKAEEHSEPSPQEIAKAKYFYGRGQKKVPWEPDPMMPALRVSAQKTSRFIPKNVGLSLSRPHYVDEELDKAVAKIQCPHCWSRRNIKRFLSQKGYPRWLFGLPAYGCSYCHKGGTPVDLGIWTEKQAYEALRSIGVMAGGE